MMNPKKRLCSFRLNKRDTIPNEAAKAEAAEIISKIKISDKPALDKR